MAKTPAPKSAPTAAPATPAEGNEPRPTTGGCFVRQPDGTLARDPSTETPEQAPEAPAQE